jgi:flagellar biosynthetic protein FliR
MPLLNPEYLLRVLLVFVRISGVLLTAPLFGQLAIPVRVRVLLAILLAYSLSGLISTPLPPHVDQAFGFMVAVAIEALTGVLLGFAAHVVFWAVEMASDLIGFQIGLHMAQVFNPLEAHSTNPLGRMLSLSTLMVFVLLEGHHAVLRVLVRSFEVVPLAGAYLAGSSPLLLQWAWEFLVLAFRLAAPFLVTILLIDVALGIFARIVPQADLFSIALPLKLLVGLGLAVFYVQHFFPLMFTLLENLETTLLRLLEAILPR